MPQRLAGQLVDGGDPVSDEPVFVVDTGSDDESNWSIVATDRSAADGSWSVTVPNADAERYHAVAQFEESGTLKNALSKPFLTSQPFAQANAVSVGFDVLSSAVSVGSAIPDSVVYQWRTPIDGLSDTDVVSTWPDSVGDNDGSGVGVTYNEGGFAGADAVSADGDGDLVETSPVPELYQTSFTWAFTYRSTQNSRGIMAQEESGDDYTRWDVFNDASGEPEFHFSGSGEILRASGSTDVHTGDVFSVIWVCPDILDAETWEIWVGSENTDPSEETVTIERDDGPTQTPTASEGFMMFARPPNGDFEIDADIGWMEIAEEAWSSDDVQNFHDKQPWS